MATLDRPAGFPGGGTMENVEGPDGMKPDSGLFAGRAGGAHGFTSGKS